ncbi:GNAT family N-acetyltransferase [Sphingobium boeckii]|uniref:RimJ/RimL family protein N-acetyltransferase n=1 Tax=Sphingobium boeckii TaxID=1082345 RepID=A0A7W9AH34_9SPHN|nr:GNAT family N-acetyltransferase [Sphingobium boeckii]MBB5685392.1 RimJ/RimL family protein N-acetyltransferase [Sphingobium boeckii]
MFARTPRLLLRPGWLEDAPALAHAIGDEAIVRNLATVPWPYDLTQAQAFLARAQDDHLPALLAFARTNGPPRLIGGCGLSRTPEGEVALGYWISRPHWGLGYATEAGRAVLEIGHALGLRRITASHFTDNPASGHVLRKLGFGPTGKIVNRTSLGRGDEAACALYALVDEVAMDDDIVSMAA